MQKIWTIAWTNIYQTYTDRSLLLIMLLTPVALVTIISLAFSDVGSDTPLQGIPVAVVNLDAGSGDGFNAGETFVAAMVAEAAGADDESSACAVDASGGAGNPSSLADLTDTTVFDARDEAIAGVNDGDYAAAVIFPADFSARLAFAQDAPWGEPVTVEVYGDGARPISASVIRSVVEGFVNQFVTGQVAVASTINTMVARSEADPAFGLEFGALSVSGDFDPDFDCAFDPAFATVALERRSIDDDDDFDPLVSFGSAQAAFFALFTAAGASASILEERRDGTLQRMIVSPTPRLLILLGKLVGVFVTVLLQLVFLFAAFTVIGSLLDGQIQFIWGENWLAIGILLIATALAGSGVGMVAAAAARSAEQANIIGSIIAMFMGTVGGAFFQVDTIEVMRPVARLSVIFWGTDGFSKLAEDQTDIALNVAILALIGAAFFAFSLVIFNRRQDI